MANSHTDTKTKITLPKTQQTQKKMTKRYSLVKAILVLPGKGDGRRGEFHLYMKYGSYSQFMADINLISGNK